jgi:hypothetical protein
MQDGVKEREKGENKFFMRKMRKSGTKAQGYGKGRKRRGWK